jgi:hypothetical protein
MISKQTISTHAAASVILENIEDISLQERRVFTLEEKTEEQELKLPVRYPVTALDFLLLSEDRI